MSAVPNAKKRKGRGFQDGPGRSWSKLSFGRAKREVSRATHAPRSAKTELKSVVVIPDPQPIPRPPSPPPRTAKTELKSVLSIPDTQPIARPPPPPQKPPPVPARVVVHIPQLVLPPRIGVALNGGLLVHSDALCAEMVSHVSELLRNEVPRQQKYVSIYTPGKSSKWVPEPRLTAFFAVDGHSYMYSNLRQPSVLGMRQAVMYLMTVARRLVGHVFDVAMVNIYRDQSDSVAAHYDHDAMTTPVASFSLGAAREFVVYHGHARPATPDRIAHKLTMQSGSLLVMQPGFQQRYLHAVPKATQLCGERINVTLRQHNLLLCRTMDHMLQLNCFPWAVASCVVEYLFWNPTAIVH